MTVRYFCLLVCTLLPLLGYAQPDSESDRMAELEDELNQLAEKEIPNLNNEVDISVTGVPIPEFLRGIATSNELNISVSPDLNQTVVNNFQGVSVKDVLIYLARKFQLEITTFGNIISVTRYEPPEPEPKAPPKPDVNYNSTDSTLTLNLRRDTLQNVAKEITQISGRNVIVDPEVKNQLIDVYIQESNFRRGIEKMALSNGLVLEETDDGFFMIRDEKEQAKNKQDGGPNRKEIQIPEGLNIKNVYDSAGKVKVALEAVDVPIAELIKVVADQSDIGYYMFSEPEEKITVTVHNASFEDFLGHILKDTRHTYEKNSDIYLIGGRNREGFRKTKVIQLQYRSTDIIKEHIPNELKKFIQISTFPELNSLILSGSEKKIREVEQFIKRLDKVVPLIKIEVIVVDVRESQSVETGVEAGIADSVQSGGSILPGVDFTLSTGSINDLLSILTDNDVVNLGRVGSDFYVRLRALEENNNIKIKSTPKLSTLNGHSAKLSIGETQYYRVTQTNIIGTQNPQTVQSEQFKQAEAQFSVSISPTVSGDDQVRLDINVNQSTFTGSLSPDAPPGKSSRSFQSLVRVKNEEMIVLGGLERARKSESNSGVPFLARVPILKWFFSSQSKQKENEKLLLFIRPSIIY